MKSQVSIVKCAAYKQEDLFPKVKEAIELIGGITKFLKPNSRVLLKPNLLMAIEPQRAITTHPEFVRAVVRILREIGCTMYIGDGPSVFGDNIENIYEVYERTGIKKVADEEKVELITFGKRFMHTYFPLTEWVKECDYVVNLPKFKTHDYMILTGAVKNLFGLIPGTFKLECHKNFYQHEKFANMLLDVYEAVKPALSIVDGISGIEGNGPATSGTKRDFGLIVASSDAVSLDTVLARIMNTHPDYIYTNKEASRRGIGTADITTIEIQGQTLAASIISDFKLPETSLRQTIKNKLPSFIVTFLKKYIYFHPNINSDLCRLCNSCVENCPQRTMSNKGGKIVIDYARCISCFCCKEFCPYAAIKTKKSLLARMMGI
ncbi:MAG: hypothetical protein A2Y00_08035 [Omnitrophica WOR_2 bacterium GWF2_43_52]|nr:MAG: hypothetical protein A2062_03995 [Omnitrophica WOR_2 bacterium GWA2_44_7]OGX21385.1 MAG: hypothetical protein A2Y00_08035 [Omnitrophica WOR_2 bacterium GWF2_43_52]OGX54825.1 MAG: hypothetical protein A2460_05930 [Omnitrophica WOR_2 bacterium RIFOXYC2_FULL_43_9]HAH21988.1 hypothetical protein [Candidatus Omnitrophota bacterium]HBG62665.1 hypothetical protein [Candidatus Omnitrophota bacterium]